MFNAIQKQLEFFNFSKVSEVSDSIFVPGIYNYFQWHDAAKVVFKKMKISF